MFHSCRSALNPPPRAWSARACDVRGVAAANGRFNRIVARRFKPLHNDAVASTVCCRSASQIARSRAPRACQISGARVECTSVRCARA
eukprot:11202406-Lingulodinium_polyedra.AAC.1